MSFNYATNPPHTAAPRDKLIEKGAHSLTDTELLAILLDSGSKNRKILHVAEQLLPLLDKQLSSSSAENIQSFKGIGPSKALTLIAALEFARRRFTHSFKTIRSPEDIMPLITYLSDRKQEHFICISLNGANEVIATRIVTVGLVNLCQVHPREVLADPITDRACSIIIAHNHPSGSLIVSEEDKALTKSLIDASRLMGINLLDHIVFSSRGYFSFKEHGLIKL